MRRWIFLGGGVIVLAVLGFGVWTILRPPEEASGPIETIPLEVEDEAAEPDVPAVPEEEEEEEAAEAESPDAYPEPEGAEAEVVVEGYPEPEAESVAGASPDEGYPEPVAEAIAEAEGEGEGSTTEEDAAGLQIYTISQAESEVRFELDEDLRGERLTVVGTSDQVSGQIGLDSADLASAQVGTIQVNARTFVTDNDRRNNAINNFVLNTADYEFIFFEPTAVVGLPASAEVGEPLPFQIVGNLTIRDITQEITFEVEAFLESGDKLVGSAATLIPLEDFEITIPDVPVVANVEDELELYIDFVAYAE